MDRSGRLPKNAIGNVNRANVRFVTRANLMKIALALFVCAILVAPHGIVRAQDGNPWMPDERIPGYLDETYTPVLLADDYGVVHAFASQNVGNTNAKGIVYRQWSLDRGWTSPVDILLGPSGDAIVQSAFLDSNDILHLVFYSNYAGGFGIYYSSVPLQLADSSPAWSVPIPIGNGAIEPSYAVISGDGSGELVVIYTGDLDGNGVYSVHSTDSGSTWSEPTPVFLTDDAKLIPYSLRLARGEGRKIHAAWSVVTNVGIDMSVHYARFDLDASKWSPAITLNERPPGKIDYFGPSFPSLVDNGNEVVVMYNNGNPLPSQRAGIGRPVQMVSVSNDNGDTWEPPIVPFIKLEGRSGEHILVQDSDRVVHALFVQRTAGDKEVLGGIWQSDYRDGFWSDPYRFTPTFDAHDLHAAVVQGNVLLMVWRIDPGVGTDGVWFTYKILNSTSSPMKPHPTLETVVTPIPSPTTEVIPTVARTSIPPDLLKQPSIGVRNPGSSFGIGIVVVVLVLFVFFVVTIASRKQ